MDVVLKASWTVWPGAVVGGRVRVGKGLSIDGRRAALVLGHDVITPEAMVKTWLTSRGVCDHEKVSQGGHTEGTGRAHTSNEVLQGAPPRTAELTHEV